METVQLVIASIGIRSLQMRSIRIAEHVKKGEGRKERKDGLGIVLNRRVPKIMELVVTIFTSLYKKIIQRHLILYRKLVLITH
jgi:hypothetical protein